MNFEHPWLEIGTPGIYTLGPTQDGREPREASVFYPGSMRCATKENQLAKVLIAIGQISSRIASTP